MSRLTEEKEEQAIRILEAMSGVDEELLARSEKTDAAKQPARVVSFWHKYGKAMAACICLAVLGTAFWGIGNLNKFSDKAAAEPQGMAIAAQESSAKSETARPESVAEAVTADEVDEATTWESETVRESEAAGDTTEEDKDNGLTSGAIKEAFDDKKQNTIHYGSAQVLDKSEWEEQVGISFELPSNAMAPEYYVLNEDSMIYHLGYFLDADAYSFHITGEPAESDISGMVYDWKDFGEFADEYGVYYFAFTDAGQGVCFWQQGEYTCTVAMTENATEEALTEARQHFAKQLAE